MNCTTIGCGHSAGDHEALAPQCSAQRCTCLRYRPAGVAAVPAPVAPIPASLSTPAVRRAISTPAASAPAAVAGVAPDALLALVRACQRSELKRTQALGVKLAALVEQVTVALRGEREAVEAKAKQAEEQATARAEVARLTKQLAAAKAKLRGSAAAGVDEAAGHLACGHCGDLFASAQGRSTHITRKHGRGAA